MSIYPKFLSGFLAGLFCALGASVPASEPSLPDSRPPRLHPDYAGITIPPNLAPLNFIVEEPGTHYRLKISSTQGKAIACNSSSAKMIIPIAPWRALLRENRGQKLFIEIGVRAPNGQWHQFDSITNTISMDDIDPCLAYRLLNPQFSMFSSGTMGIYQRNLEAYDESPILELKDRTGGTPGCLNCHTFLNRQPDTMTLHLRSPACGKLMMMVDHGRVTKIDQLAGYMSWHPSGKLITF